MASTKSIGKSGNELAHLQARTQFRTLLAVNPNYFGNLADNPFPPILSIQGNTFYEEIGCVGYHPQQEYLEAVVYINQPSGYNGTICQAGSLEYVRFYLSFDNGATWADQGLSSVRAWDIPEGTEGRKRLEYAVPLKVDPPRRFCKADHLIQVRAILSWNNPPPANQHNWVPVWGEVQDATIQVEPFKFIFPHDLFDLVKVKLPPDIAEVLDFETPLPLSKKTLAATELAVLYKNKDVPPHRFAFKELMQFTSQPVALNPAATALGPGIKLDVDLFDVLFPKDGDISYEELTCIGLDPNFPDTLVGIVKVKKSSGYSGGPCTNGSREYVTWWADFDGNGSFETCLGTSEVRVYDLNVPPQGVHYAVRLPVDMSAYRDPCKKGPRLVRIRAILSWNVPVPCANPNQVPTWGNREETVVHIAPRGVIVGVPGKIAILGGIPTQHIDDVSGLTTASAVFALNNNPPDVGGRPCPFAAAVTAQGVPVAGHSYIVEVSPDGNVWTPVLTDLIVTDQNGNTSPHQANPVTNRFDYLPFTFNVNGLLAKWNSTGDALWQVRLTVYDAAGNPVGSPDLHRVQLDNTGPDVSIDIVTGTGNCGKFGIGTVLSGNFVARDDYLGSYSLGVEPAVNDPGEGVPVPAAGSANTPPAPGTGWTLDTAGMIACGYVIRVVATDRAIVNSQSVGHHRTDSAGFCLEEL
ncbi:MAG: hypothetical protein L0Z07_06350 [Planctomycetes bacterium]|nr:hypothetical protein [Planctomycetota bacterium]